MTLLNTNDIPEVSGWHTASGAVMTVVLSFLVMVAVNFVMR